MFFFVFELSKLNKNITLDLLTKKLFGSSGFKGEREEEPVNEHREELRLPVSGPRASREKERLLQEVWAVDMHAEAGVRRLQVGKEWQEQCNPTSLLKSEFSIMQKVCKDTPSCIRITILTLCQHTLFS